MATEIRFQGLVKTTAEIEADKFAGRVGWSTTLARYIAYYNSTQYAQMARRDVLETFAAGLQDSTLGVGLPMFAGTAGRLSTESVSNFRTRIGAVNKAGDTMTGALAVSTATGGVTVGTDASTATEVLLQAASASQAQLRVRLASGDGIRLYSSATEGGIASVDGGTANYPLTFVKGDVNGLMTIRRPLNVAANLSVGGVQRISSGGAGTLTTLSTTGLATLNSLKVTGQAGTGNRLVQASSDGTNSASIPVPTAFIQTLFGDANAPTARATLGATASAYGGIIYAGDEYTSPTTQAISSGPSWQKLTPFTGNTPAGNCTPSYSNANITSNVSAVYRVSCTLSVSASIASTISIAICKNNAHPDTPSVKVDIPTGASTIHIDKLIPLTAGEYVDVRVVNTGTAFTLSFYSATLDIFAVQS